jgi:hypothetical protein
MACRSKEEKSDKKLKPFDHRYRITMKASHRIENSCRAAKMHQKISFRRKILFFFTDPVDSVFEGILQVE